MTEKEALRAIEDGTLSVHKNLSPYWPEVGDIDIVVDGSVTLENFKANWNYNWHLIISTKHFRKLGTL